MALLHCSVVPSRKQRERNDGTGVTQCILVYNFEQWKIRINSVCFICGSSRLADMFDSTYHVAMLKTPISDHRIFFTARIRRMGKVMFSVCPQPGVGGGSTPPPSQVLWSLVPGPFLEGYPSPRYFPWSLVPATFQGVPQIGGYPSNCLEWGHPRPGVHTPR